MKNNIYKSAAQVSVFAAVEKALGFIYRIILSRTIGAEGLGIYQICLSVFALFLTVASGGIPVTVSRLIAKSIALGDERAKRAQVSAGLVCTLIITLPAAVILFFARSLYAFLFPDGNCVKIFLWLLPGLVLTSLYAVLRGSFWGNKQFLPYSLIELAENAVMLVCGSALIIFAKSARGGAKAATIAVFISYVFSFTAASVWYFVSGGKLASPRGQIKPLLLSSLPITAMRTSTSLINSCVAMFLPTFLAMKCGYTEAEAITLYGTVIGMSVPILMIPNSLIGSIALVVAPELSGNFYAGRQNLLKRDIERTVNASLSIAAVLVPLAYTAGKDIGVLLYANELSGEMIACYAFMMLPMCLSIITTTILNSLNFEIKTLIYFFCGALGMLACIFLLTPKFGIHGYMAGLAASLIITAALNLRLLKRACPDVKFARYAALCAGICVAACAFGKLLYGLIGGYLPTFFKIAVCGGAASAFALCAFYGMEMISSRPIKKLFKKS